MADITRGFDHIFTDSSVNSLIIPPVPMKHDEKIRFVHLSVDSRERNSQKYENPNSYVISMNEPINDVVSVELLSTIVPFTRYLIHSHNNRLHFKKGDGVEEVITIPEGDYNVDQLAETMNTLFTDISCEISDPKTKRMRFDSDSNFSLLFEGLECKEDDGSTYNKLKNKSIGYVLGFRNKDVDSIMIGARHEVHANYPVKLNKDDYVVLKLDNVNIYSSNCKSLNKAFAIICRNPDTTNVNYTESIVKRLNPPLATLYRLRISFNDFDGNLYDFNNNDHRIELKIGILKSGRRT